MSQVSKKITVNLTIDTGVLQELRREASSQNLSLNAKINLVLLKHVNFYRHAENTGCAIWDPKVFLSFLDLIHDEDKIVDILWNEGGAAVMSFFSHKNIQVSKKNIIKYIYEGIALWTGQYSFFSHYIDSEGYTCLVFDHKFGIKWSRILASLHSRVIKHWLGAKTVVNITSKTVVLKILEKNTD